MFRGLIKHTVTVSFHGYVHLSQCQITVFCTCIYSFIRWWNEWQKVIYNNKEQLPHLPHTQGSSLRFHWGSPPRWWWCFLCPSLSGGPGRRGTAPASAHPETAAACQTAGADGDQCRDTVIHKLALWGQINIEDKNELWNVQAAKK